MHGDGAVFATIKTECDLSSLEIDKNQVNNRNEHVTYGSKSFKI